MNEKEMHEKAVERRVRAAGRIAFVGMVIIGIFILVVSAPHV